jgi:hypothetical protein
MAILHTFAVTKWHAGPTTFPNWSVSYPRRTKRRKKRSGTRGQDVYDGQDLILEPGHLNYRSDKAIFPTPVRPVLAPDGSVLTLADLPAPTTERWVASRKAIVVAAMRGGLLSMSDACARYRLTTEEFLSWQMQVDRNGLQGLHTTRVQEYRSRDRNLGLHDVRRTGLRSDRDRLLVAKHRA